DIDTTPPPPHLAATTTPPQLPSLPPCYHHPPNQRRHVTAIDTIVTFDNRHLHLHHIHHLLVVIISEPPPRPPCHHLKGAFGFAYNSTTRANLNPMISPAFVEENYEVLESLLRGRRRQIRNEDLRTGLEYFSEDYDEEREKEPRPEPNSEATPTLRLRSPVVRRQRERIVGPEEAPNREGSRGGRNIKGRRPSEIETRENGNRGVNLPSLLAAHLRRNESGQPL
nr:hypothetical protein [Tanacetum cinerariifolium]